MSAISNFINTIRTAVYGEQVRGAIADATIIIKASENTTYNNVSYSAGDTIITSEVA